MNPKHDCAERINLLESKIFSVSHRVMVLACRGRCPSAEGGARRRTDIVIYKKKETDKKLEGRVACKQTG